MAISTFPIETRTVNIDLLESAEPNATAAAVSAGEALASAAAAATFADEAEEARLAAVVAQEAAEAAQALAETAANNAQASSRTVATWTALAALTGAVAGEGAEVLDADTGTHTDPVAGGTVNNAGRYSWSASPAGWERIGATGLSAKADASRLASTTATALDVAQTGTTFTTRLAFGRFFDEVDVPDNTIVAAHTIRAFRIAAGGVTVRYRLWTRPEASTEVLGPGDGADDVMVADLTLPVSGFAGLTAGGSAVDITVTLADLVRKTPGLSLGFEVWCVDGASANVVVGIGTNNAATLLPIRRALWFRPTSSTWSNSAALTAAGIVTEAETFVMQDLGFQVQTDRIDALETLADDTAELADETAIDVALIEGALETVSVAAYERPAIASSFAATVGFAWSAGGLIPAGTRFNRVMMALNPTSAAHIINIEIYERTISGDMNYGAGRAGDVLVASITPASAADLGLTVGQVNEVSIPLAAPYVAVAGKAYLIKGYALSGSTFQGVGIGRGLENADPSWQRGHRATNATNAANGVWSAISGTASARWAIYADQFVVASDTGASVISAARVALPGVATQGQTTDAVVIPAIQLRFGDRITSAPTATVVLDNPAIEAGETFTGMSLSFQVQHEGSQTRLVDHQYIKNPVVTRASDSTVLTLGTDYAVDLQRGSFWQIPNSAAYLVNITYDGLLHRYDAIVMDRATRAIEVIKGTDRAIDPEEHKPAVPVGKVLLYWAYVFWNPLTAATNAEVELIEVATWRQGVFNIRRSDMFERDCKYNRKALAGALGKLRSGQPFKLIGHGTSITAQGGGVTPIVDDTAIPADSVQINANRDRDVSLSIPSGIDGSAGDYLIRYPADTKANIPFFDVTGNANNYDNGRHTRIGWNFGLIDGLHQIYGRSDIIYRNLGIGSTTSANTFVSGRLNGSHPARLAAAVAEAGQLAVIDFLMNDLGSNVDTYANLSVIVQALQAVGTDVILLAGPQVMTQDTTNKSTQSEWRAKVDEILDCAIDNGCGFFSSQMLEGVGYNGGSGLSLRSFCNANAFNHPGPAQLQAIGRGLASIFV